jgi:zinc protease
MAATPAQWEFREARLDNGLRIITLEDHKTPIASVQVWYHVGSKDEDPERQGFAHMFEHMMFRGTDKIGPQDHFRYLNRYGARINGYTSFDMTVYWETLPASQLDLALWLEAERMGHLKINEAYFAAEREVVKEERRMRYLNRPYGRMFETLFDAAFDVHPYRWTPIGNMPHLNAATADELRAFFETWYVPNNATLVVVGDVRHEDVVEKARKYFGDIPRRPDPPRLAIVEPPRDAPRRVEITDRAPSPRVLLSYRTPSARDPDALVLNVLKRILSSGQSSRMYRGLVQGKEIAVDAGAFDYILEQGGLFVLSATLKPEVAVDTAEEALLDEVQHVLNEGVTGEELDKAKNQAIAEYVRESETVQGRAEQLGYAAVILDDVNRVNTDLERMRAITAGQVLDVSRRIFEPANRVTVIIRPDENPPSSEEVEDKSEAKSEDIVDLPQPEEMPTGNPPAPADLPFPELRTLENGLQVVVFTDHSVPAVTVSYDALVGARNDPPDKAGLGMVTASTLRRGTARHTGDELAEIIDSHAMSLSESVDHESSTVAVWTLTEHLDLAVGTLAEVLREPTFPESEIRNYVARAAAREAINEKDPSTLASRALDETLYGEHYLARPASGTSESLKRITVEDVQAFHRRFFAPHSARVIFAGDVGFDQAVSLAGKWFGDWRGEPKPVEAAALPEQKAKRVLLLDQDGAVQSEIRIGERVPLTRKDQDYAAARLLSQIFGESFDARLNRVLRIEKGLTYYARGYFDVNAGVSSLKVATFTRTDRTEEAIRSALEEIDGLNSEPPDANTLAAARHSLIGRFQMALETPAQVGQMWWNLVVWDLPEGWYTRYQRDIADTKDPGALTAAAGRLIRPGELTIVVVGDADALKDELGDIAPVEIGQAR